MVRIVFEPAKIDDAELLLAWRNDPLTRELSHNKEPISLEAHIKWLSKVLENSNRQLFIALVGQDKIGTVRADKLESTTELSWTIAPEARGKGFGKSMLKQFVELTDRPISAEVLESNTASIKMAEFVGMKCQANQDGVLKYLLS